MNHGLVRALNFVRDWRDLVTLAAEVAVILTFVGVLASAVQYLSESDSRKKAAALAAWSIVSGAEHKRADSGRSEAIKELIAQRQDLAGLQLDSAILHGVKLERQLLLLMNLHDVRLRGCSFEGSSLIRTDMSGGRFEDGCSFRGTRFIRSDLRSSNFDGQDLRMSEFTRVHADSRTSLNGADLAGATFSAGLLNEAVFDSAHLEGSTFINSVGLVGTRFIYAHLEGCSFVHVDAQHAQFQQSWLERCSIQLSTNLHQATFDRAHLRGAVFRRADLSGASFFGADLRGVNFIECNIDEMDLTSARLEGAVFSRNRGKPVLRVLQGVRPAGGGGA